MITLKCERCGKTAKSKELGDLVSAGWKIQLLNEDHQLCRTCLKIANKEAGKDITAVA